jgi:cell division protein ZapE
VTPVEARYKALIAAGELRPDPDQEAAVAGLGQLQLKLERGQPQGGFFARLMGSRPAPPGGIYMWGGVGRGSPC